MSGLVESLEDHRLGSQLGFKESEEQVIGAACGSPSGEESMTVDHDPEVRHHA